MHRETINYIKKVNNYFSEPLNVSVQKSSECKSTKSDWILAIKNNSLFRSDWPPWWERAVQPNSIRPSYIFTPNLFYPSLQEYLFCNHEPNLYSIFIHFLFKKWKRSKEKNQIFNLGIMIIFPMVNIFCECFAAYAHAGKWRWTEHKTRGTLNTVTF